MGPDIDLVELERKAWTTYFQDGLLEIMIGLILLVTILSSTLSTMGVDDATRISIYVPLMFLCPIIYVVGKKYITIPRLGYVKFGKARKEKNKKAILGLIITQCVMIIIFIQTNINNIEPSLWTSVIVALNIFVALSLIALFLDYPRMYIMAALFAVGEPIYYYLEHNTNITHIGLVAYGVPAAIILIMGTVALLQFLKKYPLPAE